jgi:hypothetical protein
VTGCFSGKTEDRQIRLERSRIVGKAAERYSLREAVLPEKAAERFIGWVKNSGRRKNVVY